ncbi:SRPBCC domain-containing protein [Pseudoxanthomonas sp. PXM02]|uniref:SRPBCC domain-containing protein n=1 Tax=Pseudoxanthomonas sp. PXM02 TaxID=2769294 RepID=UPI00177E2E4E|nr:SRPBCC domain-containing protein [Pseudoxanthomonas sp. PXM02]
MKQRLRNALLLVALVATPAYAEIKDAKPEGFTIENSVWVPATPQVAYAALVNDVGRWWPADHTWWGDASKLSISDKAGGCFCEINGAQQAWHMTVTFTDPGKLMRMTGGLGPLQGMGLSGALEWRFAEENTGTRITLWYRAGGYTPDDIGKFAPVVDKVQGLQLGGLATFLGAPLASPPSQ